MSDLIVKDLTVEFAAGDYVVRPLDELSFDVPTGSLAILLGPSGCGKTTLLSCLAGILSPTRGSIRFADEEVAGLTGAALTKYRRHTVGVVFQAFNLVPSLSVTENVMAPLLAAGVRKGAARTRAVELLERVDLGHRLDYRPGDLSGGQQQRVAIARSLVHDPPLILADEPTAHLDYVQVEEIIRLIRELAAPGRVVVVATHDERMLPLADQVIELVPRSTPPSASGASMAKRAVRPTPVSLAPGEVVFEEGSRGELVYLVNAGEIEIVRETPAGGEHVVAVLGAGDYFGEMGPLFDLPRSATARARGAAVVTGYPLAEFRDVLGVEHLRDLVATKRTRRRVTSRSITD